MAIQLNRFFPLPGDQEIFCAVKSIHVGRGKQQMIDEGNILGKLNVKKKKRVHKEKKGSHKGKKKRGSYKEKRG